jgi:hypothetical protein
MPGEAALHDHVDRTAQCVQAEHRIGAPHIQPVHRHLRNCVPVDRVAESLVQAHAVLVDSNALWHSLQRGCFKAMEAHILEQDIALGIAKRNTGGLHAQCVQHGGAMLGGELAGAEALQLAGDLVGGNANVGIGQGAIHHDMFGPAGLG